MQTLTVTVFNNFRNEVNIIVTLNILSDIKNIDEKNCPEKFRINRN